MNSAVSAAALFILLTPALAQQADQPLAEQPQQNTAATDPNAGQGMTQAQALAQAAQDEASAPRDSNQAPAAQPLPDQPQPGPQQQPSAAPSQTEPSRQQQDDTAQTSAQPLPERRTLAVNPTTETTRAVRPRADATAYPVYRLQPQLSIGAKLLSSSEIETKFSTPIGKHYLVVEVGAFPADAKPVPLRAQSFTLRIANDDDQAFFPATPEDIAGALTPKNGGRPRNVGFFPGVGVGYGRGPWGPSTNVGVGVGVGGPRPYPRNTADTNYRTIVQELRDKSLPEGDLTQPVAGYLYFPLNGKRAKNYNLELNQNGQTVSLALPTPKD
jgi:hypothetical protein